MAASGGAPAATACSHCARPISAPSLVTTEFNDMFWPLKGATDTPSRASSRQSPATTVDLPASEVVPHTISAPPRVVTGTDGWRRRVHDDLFYNTVRGGARRVPVTQFSECSRTST